MKKLLALSLLALPMLATPANAITWEDFWEPFDSDVEIHHHYHEHGRPRRYRRPPVRKCVMRVEKDRFVPGYMLNGRWVHGYWTTVYKRKLVPCWKLGR